MIRHHCPGQTNRIAIFKSLRNPGDENFLVFITVKDVAAL